MENVPVKVPFEWPLNLDIFLTQKDIDVGCDVGTFGHRGLVGLMPSSGCQDSLRVVQHLSLQAPKIFLYVLKSLGIFGMLEYGSLPPSDIQYLSTLMFLCWQAVGCRGCFPASSLSTWSSLKPAGLTGWQPVMHCHEKSFPPYEKNLWDLINPRCYTHDWADFNHVCSYM